MTKVVSTISALEGAHPVLLYSRPWWPTEKLEFMQRVLSWIIDLTSNLQINIWSSLFVRGLRFPVSFEMRQDKTGLEATSRIALYGLTTLSPLLKNSQPITNDKLGHFITYNPNPDL